MTENGNGGENKTRVTNSDVLAAVERINGRLDDLEARIQTIEAKPLEVRAIARDEAQNIGAEFKAQFEDIVKRIESSADGMQQYFAQLIRENLALVNRVERVEREHADIRSLVATVQTMASNVQGSLNMIVELTKARDAQVMEHSKDIDDLQADSRKLHAAVNNVRDEVKDNGYRMGAAFTPILGYNPATPEATRTFPNLIERVGNIEKAQAEAVSAIEAVSANVKAIDARFNALSSFGAKILPARVRRVILNTWVIRAIVVVLSAATGINLLEVLSNLP